MFLCTRLDPGPPNPGGVVIPQVVGGIKKVWLKHQKRSSKETKNWDSTKTGAKQIKCCKHPKLDLQ